jgi:hypothetical protein
VGVRSADPYDCHRRRRTAARKGKDRIRDHA